MIISKMKDSEKKAIEYLESKGYRVLFKEDVFNDNKELSEMIHDARKKVERKCKCDCKCKGGE